LVIDDDRACGVFESQLELARLLLADFDPRVTSIWRSRVGWWPRGLDGGETLP
jgi:hypothetical protein